MTYQPLNPGQSTAASYNPPPMLYHHPAMYSAPANTMMNPNGQSNNFQNRRKRRGVKRPANDGKMNEALKKLERMDTLEDQVKAMLKEKEEAAEAARNKELADEKAGLQLRGKLLDEREKKLEENIARLEEIKAQLAEERRLFVEERRAFAEERRVFEKAKTVAAREKIARKSVPWYRRKMF